MVGEEAVRKIEKSRLVTRFGASSRSNANQDVEWEEEEIGFTFGLQLPRGNPNGVTWKETS